MPLQRTQPTHKQQRPRRTHQLGGCATCRRRHLKCDQTRPECTACRNSGLECGGFPSQVRWASLSTKRRSPALIGKSQASEKNTSKRSDQDSDTSILTQINTQPAEGEVADNVDTASSAASTAPHTGTVGESQFFNFGDADAFDCASTDLFSDLDSLFQPSGRLGWNDLFESSLDFSISALPDSGSVFPLGAEPCDTTRSDTCNWSEQFGLQADCGIFLTHQGTDTGSSKTMSAPQPPSCTSTIIDETEVLTYAQALLKDFRDQVIPQLSPLPMHTTSPWELLNWSAAVRTLADMTYLRSTNITHASQANLFAVLGCSAYNLAKTTRYRDNVLYQKDTQIADYVTMRAREHMQVSLRSETSGSRKAKYKDQMMAILSLILLMSLSDKSSDARCYLIDAERLARLRGLTKQKFSRRVRLVHHVYTWYRIIGESSFVLYDQRSHERQNNLKKILQNNMLQDISPTSEQDTTVTYRSSELDDFLRVEPHDTDIDSDADPSKNPEIGYRDIHLADSRPFAPSLYVEVYGIPEIWLSLVSQVTRVANLIDLLGSCSIQAPQTFTSSLERKINRLEQKVCSFAVEHNISSTLPSAEKARAENQGLKHSVAGRHMLRAMSSALVIFFYRRIRNVHPWILQAHVNDVIAALTEFDAAQQGDKVILPGTPWPAFIAGCEAMSASLQDWLMAWLEKNADQLAFNGLTRSQTIMREVWAQRAAPRKGNSEGTHGNRDRVKDGTCSWVDVLRQNNSWLMLY